MIRIQTILLLILNLIISQIGSVFTVLVLTLSLSTYAQWSRDPSDAIRFGGSLWAIHLASDSLGGVFIHAAGGFRTYCYYIDSNGYPRWDEWIDIAPLAESSPPPGHIICPETGYVIALTYSEWHSEEGDTSWDIRAQKIDAEGELVWPDSGVSVSNMRLRFEDNASFDVIGMESDGEGGVIIVWVVQYDDDRGYLIRQPFLAQRISADGELLWDDEGVEVFNEDSLCTYGRTVSDGEGGIIILNNLGGFSAQRISPNGDKLWGASGVRYAFDAPRYAIPDGFGGVVVSISPWGRGPVRVLRLNADGEQLWGDGNGVIVKDAERPFDRYLHYSYLAQASDSVFFVNWKGVPEEEPNSLVQAIDLSGELIWDWPGIPICEADTISHTLRGVTSLNSVVYGWTAYRPSDEREGARYAQRLDVDGNKLWQEDGVLLLDRTRISIESVATDCYGGAIFFIGSYLQQINRDGELGIPLSVRDFDQSLLEGPISYSIFPNPVNSLTTLKFATPAGRDVVLKFYDFQGRLIFDDLIHPGVLTHPLDISALPSGSYILHFKSGALGSSQTLNIIK